MHTAEVGLMMLTGLLLAYAAQKLLAVDFSVEIKGLFVLGFVALGKAARVSESVPIPDYVNGSK